MGIEKTISKASVAVLAGIESINQTMLMADRIEEYERRIRTISGAVGYHTAHIGVPLAEGFAIAGLGYMAVKVIDKIWDKFIYAPKSSIFDLRHRETETRPVRGYDSSVPKTKSDE